MSLKNKEHIFKKLAKRTKQNRYLITQLKKLIVSLIIIFIILSFVAFYTNIINIAKSTSIIFYTLLIVIFTLLVGIHFFVKSKEQENKNIDTKIFHLLKLKV